MKRLIIILTTLILLEITLSAHAATVLLKWDAVKDNSLAGYKVYYSNTNIQPFAGTGADQGSSPILINAGMETATISALDPTKIYYFAVTAINTQGMESVYSNIVTVPAFPIAPANVRTITILITP